MNAALTVFAKANLECKYRMSRLLGTGLPGRQGEYMQQNQRKDKMQKK